MDTREGSGGAFDELDSDGAIGSSEGDGDDLWATQIMPERICPSAQWLLRNAHAANPSTVTIRPAVGK